METMANHNIKKLVAIRGGAMGDFILTLPAINALRSRFPHAHMSLIGNPSLLSLAQADGIFDHNSALFTLLYTHSGELSPATRKIFEDVDLLLAYSVDPDGVFANRLNSLVKGRVIVFDPRPSPQSESHIIDHLLEPLHLCGIPVLHTLPKLNEEFIDRGYALQTNQLNCFSKPLVVIHPGSGGRHKRWPLNHFIKLINNLTDQAIQVAVSVGPAEATMLQELTAKLPISCPVLTAPGIPQLAGLLESADLFIGNDSGPSHLAAALETPTLALFGPTNPQTWSPRGTSVRVLQAPTGNLKALEIDSVQKAIYAQLAQNGMRDGRK